MALNNGERQVAPTIEGVRADHVARYRWLASRLKPRSRVLDVACGVGYGARILAEAGHRVIAVDRDQEAIAYASEHYGHENITFMVGDACALGLLGVFDAAASFETVEHLEHPVLLLRDLRRSAPRLFVSVPNEDVFPFRGYAFHHRHYTAEQFRQLLASAGLRVTSWHGQAGPESEVESAVNGRTLVVEAEPGAGEGAPIPFELAPKAPEHVVILGLGPSLESYVDLVKRLGSRRAFADEVWGINAVGDVIQCDRILHMDDVRVQEARAAAAPQSNIANMLAWMREHPGPIYTSRIPEENAYPGLVEFPLENVINNLGYGYFNGTCAYAVALAIHIGVKKISMFGCDFTQAASHFAERGRANVEFWLGYAAARGIALGTSDRTSLLDACEPANEFYGYDAVTVNIDAVDGQAKVTFEPKELPTAAEIEKRYDHSRHPNRLVENLANRDG